MNFRRSEARRIVGVANGRLCSWCGYTAAIRVRIDGAAIRLCLGCVSTARREKRNVRHLERANQ